MATELDEPPVGACGLAVLGKCIWVLGTESALSVGSLLGGVGAPSGVVRLYINSLIQEIVEVDEEGRIIKKQSSPYRYLDSIPSKSPVITV